MKNLLSISILLLSFWCFLALKASPQEKEEKEYNSVETLPGVYLKSLGTNFKGAQPDSTELIAMLKSYPIDVVIRLNADGNKMSVEQEAAICKRENVRFYYFNIEGNTKSIYGQISNLLQDGNTLVHCLHGFDRTGVIMGLWMKENNYSNQQIIAFNKWENYLENKGEKYRKYWDAVFMQ